MHMTGIQFNLHALFLFIVAANLCFCFVVLHIGVLYSDTTHMQYCAKCKIILSFCELLPFHYKILPSKVVTKTCGWLESVKSSKLLINLIIKEEDNIKVGLREMWGGYD